MKSKINNNAAPQAKKLCGAMKRAALTLLALIMTCATAWAYNAVFTISAATPQPFTFSGNQIKPIVTWVTITDDNNNVITQYDQNQFTVTYGTNINAGETRCEINVRITAEGAYQDWVFTKYYPIAKRPMFVNINNCEKHYGEADPTFTWQLVDDNDVQQDSIYNLRNRLLPRRLNGHLTRTAGEDMGDYTISYDGTNPIELANYQVTVNEGTLTITDPLPDSYIFSVNADSTEYTIRTVLGWNYFCDMLDNSNKGIFTGKTVKLGTDIGTTENPVSRMAGSESKPFAGNFDGQDYTLTFNCNTSDDYVAPFRYVTGGIGNVNNHATISNLNVVSTINGSTHLAGLIANQKGIVDLTNCHVTATIVSTATTDSYCAGLVSHAAMRDPNDQTGYGNENNGTLTISGCTVSGRIITYGKYAGGFVGMAEGKTSIVNSVSGVTINSFVGGNGTHGGFIGLQQHTLNYANVSTTIEGCLFNGKLITSNGTTNCGGFIGWHDGGSLEIKHCLYAPADLGSGETEISDGSTFVGNGTVGSNCIYTRALGTAQGKATHSITAGEYVTISNIALINFLSNPDVYDVSGITSYDYGGISCGDDLYICEDAYVSLVLSNDYPDPAPAGSVYGYTVSGGELEDNGNGTYTLTMPNADITIEVDPTQTITLEWSGTGTESDPYMIYSKEQLDLVASRMYQSGYTYGSDQDYEGHPDGYFFKLGADIVYPYTSSTENNFTPIGNSYPYPSFQGTFDGDGHTISGIRINADYLSSNGYYFGNFGLFGEVAGTIKNVILADAVITGSSNLGGIVGNNYGTLENNLVIGATIPAATDNSHGAICGSNYGTLEHNYYVGCTVAGVENAIGVGCGSIYDEDEEEYITADITENDGAMPGNARTVEGYGDSEKVGWTFIASPLTEDTDPESTAVQNIFIASEFDLFRLNPSNTMWENYKQTGGHYHFSLENGRGYLYATQEQETVKFIGTTNSAYNLNDTEDVTLGEGFNLVGNPFPRAAYVNKSYYKLNTEGSAIVAEPVSSATYISPCNGVIIQSTANEVVTFSTTAPGSVGATPNNSNLNIALTHANTRSNALLDNAIVSFNEGSQLGKFYFGQQDANIYIPQGQEEYAIAFSESQGEMPLNFKATKNGTYTITVNPEGVELAYLHLIDNLTGADVDLLASPTYTFTAKTTDYESRFKLVFSASADANGNNEAFAFIDASGNIIVNGTGTLQVIDMTGRVLYTAEANSAFRIQHSAFPTPGVYVLRLINGEHVRTQKIVVE